MDTISVRREAAHYFPPEKRIPILEGEHSCSFVTLSEEDRQELISLAASVYIEEWLDISKNTKCSIKNFADSKEASSTDDEFDPDNYGRRIRYENENFRIMMDAKEEQARKEGFAPHEFVRKYLGLGKAKGQRSISILRALEWINGGQLPFFDLLISQKALDKSTSKSHAKKMIKKAYTDYFKAISDLMQTADAKEYVTTICMLRKAETAFMFMVALLTGPEIMEYAKNTNQTIQYDLVTGKLRYVDSSGLLDGILPASFVDISAKRDSGDIQKDSVKDISTQDNGLVSIDMGKVAEELNSLGKVPPALGSTMARSMAPMPIINSYRQDVPAYGGSGRQRITAAMLKNKVLHSCRLLVKDGVLFSFDGKCYQALSEAKVKQMISAVCRNELEEYGRFEIVTGALNFILSEPNIQILEDIENHKILTFQNGNLDIETGVFTSHDPNIFTTYALQCNYIPHSHGAMCPVFDKFLWDISSGDLLIIARIWEMLGYCLVPDIGAKIGFVLQGRKHSGKSLMCNFLESIFPRTVISALDVHNFSKQFALSELEGKALCISADMPAEPLNRKDVSIIKKLSGNDLLSAAKKYESNRQFRFGGKLILVSNHQILSRTDDDAFWDRLVAIPFPNTIPRERQDANLLYQLISEKDSIVSKAINAYWELKKRSYHFSGDYLLNSGSFLLDSAESGRSDMKPLIQDFLLKNYETAPYDEVVFMSDAHAMFEQMVGPVYLNQFGLHFGNMAIGILRAVKDKVRKKGETNATSCLRGIRLKNSQ